jgi:hypothetical protein
MDMENLAQLRRKTIETGLSWIVERIYASEKDELPVIEGFEQEEAAFERMRELIEEATGRRFLTPHCDPTINLHDYLHVVRLDTIVDIWQIVGCGVL